jgi:hypothetical protein
MTQWLVQWHNLSAFRWVPAGITEALISQCKWLLLCLPCVVESSALSCASRSLNSVHPHFSPTLFYGQTISNSGTPTFHQRLPRSWQRDGAGKYTYVHSTSFTYKAPNITLQQL